MAKVLRGKVVSVKMHDTVVVEVVRHIPHKLYKKLLTRDKKYKVDSKGKTVNLGDTVRIVGTKPLSKDKHFILVEGEKK